MSSPELVAPARLEELLGGAFPETHDEARLQGLARELRSGSVSAPVEAFVEAVEQALASDSEEAVARRRDLAKTNTWEARTERLLDLVDGRLAG